MNLNNNALALKQKMENAAAQIEGASAETIRTILEDLSDEMRTTMSKTSVECYDTLTELDFLCTEAEMRVRLPYDQELKGIIALYESEVNFS